LIATETDIFYVLSGFTLMDKKTKLYENKCRKEREVIRLMQECKKVAGVSDWVTPDFTFDVVHILRTVVLG
jgi:hypothetical protein